MKYLFILFLFSIFPALSFSDDLNENYIKNFLNSFPEQSSIQHISDYASQLIYDEELDNFMSSQDLSSISNENAAIAWGFSYVIMSLNKMIKLTKGLKYIETNLKIIDQVIKSRDDFNGKRIIDGNIYPVWGCCKYTPKRTAFLVHTGMITYSVLEFLKITEDCIPKNKFMYILSEMEKSVNHHDIQWKSDGKEGFYFGKNQEAGFNGKPLPINRLSSIGRSLYYLWKLTGKNEYLVKTNLLANYIKDRLYICEDNSYCWSYFLDKEPLNERKYKSKYSITPEDSSHGALSISFPVLLAKDNIIFDQNDIEMFSNTFLNGVAKLENGILFGNISGKAPSNPRFLQEMGRWLNLDNEEVFYQLSLFFTKYVEKPSLYDLSALIEYQFHRE